ncbi:MAG: hypothetical protein MJ211_11035 [Bacteroidales bacterium]|nr:hypothetical protein [Bacteroidales bacterium]
MKIFKLYNIVNGYKTIDFGEINITSISKGEIDIECLSNSNLNWKKTEDDLIPSDSPFFIGAFPIFEYSKIEKLNIPIDFVHFFVENVDFVAIKSNIIEINVLNRDKSIMKLFKSGKIMSINKYVFNKYNYPPIFRIKEYPLFTFVNEEIAELLKNSNLKQIKFEECEVI